MNDAYGFALWIWADLAVIALGGGAFFTGFLKYIVGKDELKNIINYAVLIGFICYSSALLILAIDIGQPLRGWFIFWHANVHSMLTEVAFCLSCYFGCSDHRVHPADSGKPPGGQGALLSQPEPQHARDHGGLRRHRRIPVLFPPGIPGRCGRRALRTALRLPRRHIFIWPWTFFLFTWSAAAYGPCFTLGSPS
jgi:hypothetical protein